VFVAGWEKQQQNRTADNHLQTLQHNFTLWCGNWLRSEIHRSQCAFSAYERKWRTTQAREYKRTECKFEIATAEARSTPQPDCFNDTSSSLGDIFK